MPSTISPQKSSARRAFELPPSAQAVQACSIAWASSANRCWRTASAAIVVPSTSVAASAVMMDRFICPSPCWHRLAGLRQCSVSAWSGRLHVHDESRNLATRHSSAPARPPRGRSSVRRASRRPLRLEPPAPFYPSGYGGGVGSPPRSGPRGSWRTTHPGYLARSLRRGSDPRNTGRAAYPRMSPVCHRRAV